MPMPQIGLFSLLDKSELIHFFFIWQSALKMISKQELNYWYLNEILRLESKPSANITRSARNWMKISFQWTFVTTEERTTGVSDSERLPLRRVLLPFSVCILPSGVIVSLLVVCCWAQHFAKSKTMSCLRGLCVSVCPFVRLLHFSIKFPTCSRQ